MSARELQEWMVFYQHEPFGGRRGDLQAAQVAGLLAEIYRDRKQREEPFRIQEFMPDYWEEGASTAGAVQNERSPEEWRALVMALNAAYGGRVEKRSTDSGSGLERIGAGD